MIIVKEPTKIKKILKSIQGDKNAIKAVCDLENRILILDPFLHIDAEDYLHEIGSKPQFVWGFYILPNEHEIEFLSMINFKPLYGNKGELITNETLKDKIRMLVTDFLDL
jgi:Protein of unknown function (DUF5674)